MDQTARMIVVLFAVTITSFTRATAPFPGKPPVAEIQPTTLQEHGNVRIDNYYWMRNREDPKTIAYLKAENKYTEQVMADTKKLEEKLFQETKARIKQTDSSVPYTDKGYEYYTRFEEGKQYPIFCRKLDQTGAGEQIMIDVNQLAEGHKFCRVSGLSVSSENNILAYSIDTVGRRIFTIRFKNLATGELLPDEIPEVSSNLVWAEDNTTLFYVKQHPETLREYRIYRHRLGTDAGQDELVYEEEDDTFYCHVQKSRSRKYLFIGSTQTLSTEYRILDAKDPGGQFDVFQPRRRDHEYMIDHIGDHFYIRTNKQAKNFRLMKTPTGATSEENWTEVIPHRDTVLLERFALFNDYLVLQERRDGLRRVRIRPWSGESEHELDFGEPTYMAFVTPTPDANTTVLRYRYTSLTTPFSTFDYDMKTREKTLRKQEEVLGGFDKSNYVTERLTCTARDGTKVPLSVVYRKGVARDGKNPCLLYGYGSYGFSMDAMFQSPRLNLLDRGFVYAMAHIRGGQELGRQWYEDGKLLRKKNTFTDFIDCGEFLIRDGLADPKRLYAQGASAGGLLIGAVVNMRPDLFHGVIAEVPFVDVVTTMLDDSIPLTTSEYDEWGNPNKKEYYDYILSYSPYDNVSAKDYPNMLVTSGLHDSQVQYFEPTKWVAKLRATKTDDNLLLLKTNMAAGHGGASGRFDRYEEIAFRHAFLLRLAGIKESGRGTKPDE